MARWSFGGLFVAVAGAWLITGCWVTNPSFGADESDTATGGESAGSTSRGSTTASTASTASTAATTSTSAGESEGTTVASTGDTTLALTTGDAATSTSGADLATCPEGTQQASQTLALANATTMTVSANMSAACAWNNAIPDCRDYNQTSGFIRMAADPVEGTSWFLFRFDHQQVMAALPEGAIPLGLSVGVTFWENLGVPNTDKVLELALLDLADADWNPAEATFRQKASGVPWSGGDLGPTLGEPLATVEINPSTVAPIDEDDAADQYHSLVRSAVFPADPVAAWVFKGKDPAFSLHIIDPQPTAFANETFGVKAIDAGWTVPTLYAEYCIPMP